MKSLVTISLLLVIVLVSLSAYIRLAHSGIGCTDWPSCYGHIGTPQAATAPVSPEDAYERLVEQSNEPLAWATPLHRLVASVLGLLIVGLCFLGYRRKQFRVSSSVLLLLTVYLALLGVRSGGLHDPAVVMGNLAGGFCMLGILGWMMFRPDSTAIPGDRNLYRWTLIAVVILAGQIFLGGLTSANFAAVACPTLPDCQGSILPGKEVLIAFDLSREHSVSASGTVIGGPERTEIHKTHRLGALLTFVAALVAGLLAIRNSSQGCRLVGGAVLVLVALEFAVGVSAVLSGLPIALAVAHNWLAALLLLALLKLMALQQIAEDTQ